jgi:hypothetical protein
VILVLAPYGRNEVTAAALRLVELAIQHDYEAVFATLGPPCRGIHPVWDRKVVRPDNPVVRQNAARIRHVIWFDLPRGDLRNRFRSASHYFVPSWHSLTPNDAEAVRSFDWVVCSTAACQQRLLERGLAEGARTLRCRWDAGLDFVAHEGLRQPDQKRLLVHCDVGTIEECSTLTLAAIEMLLVGLEDVACTVTSTKTWSRSDRRRIARMRMRWGHRLCFMPQTTFPDQVRLIHEHDWTLLPSVRCDFGMTTMRSLACGVPVIVHELPPFDEFVVSEGPTRNGTFIPCEILESTTQAPIAVTTAHGVATAVSKALSGKRPTLKASESKNFTTFWTRLWDE